MVIDAHVHIGNAFWGNFSPEFLLEIIGDNIGICSNLEAIDSYTGKDELEANMDMLKAAQKYRQIKPLVVCQAERTQDNHVIKYLLKEYSDIVGLKFHPEFTKLPATSEKYDKYLELAREFKKPCLYHSGHIKSKYSSPLLIYEKAKQFPDVPIILGHLSTSPFEQQKIAIDIMVESIEKENAVLYADLSWVGIDVAIELIEALKNTSKGDFTNRIMWASDAPVGGEVNQRVELYNKNLNLFKVKILEYFKDEELLNKLLYKNARELFNF